MMQYNKTDLAYYLAEYIETERERGNPIDNTTIENALEAFEGGAYNGDGGSYQVRIVTLDGEQTNLAKQINAAEYELINYENLIEHQTCDEGEQYYKDYKSAIEGLSHTADTANRVALLLKHLDDWFSEYAADYGAPVPECQMVDDLLAEVGEGKGLPADFNERVRELGAAIEDGDPQTIADLWVHHVSPALARG